MLLRTDDLNPDGVIVRINWERLCPGNSVFIPCVNTFKAIQQLKKIALGKNWQITTKIRLESGRLGVRVWRTV